MPFALRRAPLELRIRDTRLAERRLLTPGMVRIRLAGEQLRGFDSPGSDDHIRIFPGIAPGQDADAGRDSREYTPAWWDADAGLLDIDVALHGGAGLVDAWAVEAPLGAPMRVGGPRGSLLLEGEPDDWLLAGDETALPAIRRFLERAPEGATGSVVLEVSAPDREQLLPAPDGVEVHWVRAAGGPSAALAAELARRTVAPGAFVFIAAEQSIVAPGRALLERSGVPVDSAVVKGYWRR